MWPDAGSFRSMTSSSPDLTLGDIVTDNAVRYSGLVAYRHDGRSVTHAELRARAVRLISALAAAGVHRQDVVAVYSRNCLEFGEVIAATQLGGIILATVNFRLSSPEVHDVLDRVRPKVIFFAEEFANVTLGAVQQLPEMPMLVRFDGASCSDTIAYDAFIAEGAPGDPVFVASPDDIACLIFTSGTTGPSKCCVLGQREMRRLMLTMNAELSTGCLDRVLINMPMFHVGALGIIGGVHARGGTVVLQRQFDVPEAVRLISEERVSVLHLAPVMLRALLSELPGQGAVDSVRTVVYSAAPMTMATLDRAMALLPGAGFLNLYGQTEVIVSGLPRELHDPKGDPVRLQSVGFPFPGTRVRIVAEDGADVAPGQAGEVVVQSGAAFRGYWNDHPATLATMRDGWCHTGDIGQFGTDGLLYLVDRKKDVIVTGGENVYSPEVENAVAAVAGVAACAVVGVPDERWGEAVCVVVVPVDGAVVTLGRVVSELRGRLASYKLPRRLVVAAKLPVLASGKVDKKKLRAQLAAGDT